MLDVPTYTDVHTLHEIYILLVRVIMWTFNMFMILYSLLNSTIYNLLYNILPWQLYIILIELWRCINYKVCMDYGPRIIAVRTLRFWIIVIVIWIYFIFKMEEKYINTKESYLIIHLLNGKLFDRISVVHPSRVLHVTLFN